MARIMGVDLSSEDDWDDGHDDFDDYDDYDDYNRKGPTSASHSSPRTRTIHNKKELSVEESLCLAAAEGRLETVHDILSKGGVKADACLPGTWTGLMHAAAVGHIHVLEYLLDHGANPNFNKDKYTPLMAACASHSGEENRLRCVEALLRHGANANACDKFRLTPLMYACKEGSEKLVKALLPHSETAAQDNQGWTVLFWAVNQNLEKIVQLLLDHGVPQHLMDRKGYMAVDLALYKQLEKIARMLGAVEVESEPKEEIHEKSTRRSFLELLLEANDKSCTTLKKDVGTILHQLGLKNFIQLFEEHNVDLLQFLTITDGKLKEMGLAPRYRKRILEAVEKFHFKPWKKSSVYIKPKNEPFSVHDGVIALCGTLRHVDLLRATIAYMKQKFENNNCKLDGDSQLVNNLRYYTNHTLHYTELLYKETLFLYRQAIDIEKYDKIIPADLIVERKQPAKSRKLSTVVMGAMIVVMVWFHMR